MLTLGLTVFKPHGGGAIVKDAGAMTMSTIMVPMSWVWKAPGDGGTKPVYAAPDGQK